MSAVADYRAVQTDVDEWRFRLNTPDLDRDGAYEYVAERLQEVVDQWHNDNGCHKHADPSVAEGVCCVCDADAPCDTALDSACEA